MKLKGFKFFVLTAFAFIAGTSAAQDLLAWQAPIDKRTQSVDSVALMRELEKDFLPIKEVLPLSDVQTLEESSLVESLNPNIIHIDLTQCAMPTTSRRITSHFGRRWGRMHKGLDIKVYLGDTICAALDGEIIKVNYDRGGYGRYIVIRHENGLETLYAHLSKQIVRCNQKVRAGEAIGLGGRTGRATGTHLHFETRMYGKAINPDQLFDFPNQSVTGESFAYNKVTGDTEIIQARPLLASDSEINQFKRRETKLKNTPLLASVFKYNNDNIFQNNNEESYSDEDMLISENKSDMNDLQIRYHEIHKGETLTSIARRNGTTIDRLCELNNVSRTTLLQIGWVLRC